jgi:exonuclease SbcC
MLDEWLHDYNKIGQDSLDENTLYELLNVSLEWIKQERAELAILDDIILSAQATYDERSKQVKNHESMCDSAFSLDELNETLEIAKLRIEELIKSETTLTVKLLQDEKNKRQSGLYLDEITKRNAKLAQWKKLDEVIGSADGKKFRQIAQKYTLEILLGYANKHLKSLSPRYQLQCVPETLALQVVDHDMGDEIRSVHYLSGGESFLVSLALALGLASLSSNRMKVESLFIDEGFGSLDPETLRTAMDALERLHNDGRKVGVISHVQEMTERIPVQIQVIKLAGKSKVEIKG